MLRPVVALVLFLSGLTVPYLLLSGRIEPDPVVIGIGIVAYIFLGLFAFMLLTPRNDPDAFERRAAAAGGFTVGMTMIVVGIAFGALLIPDADSDSRTVAYTFTGFPIIAGLWFLAQAAMTLRGRKFG